MALRAGSFRGTGARACQGWECWAPLGIVILGVGVFLIMKRKKAGDLVSGVTSAMGIAPCESCEQRRVWMNNHLW